MSLLLSEGHTEADRYPLAKVWSEVYLARERIRDRISQETVLMHAAMVDVLGGKSTLKNTLEKMRDGE